MKPSEGQADLRVRRTHKLLWDAFMAELCIRPFEEITIKDICERAMVHRTTFYKHYEDKYALFAQGIGQMEADLMAEINALPGAASASDPTPAFILIFVHAARHQHFYKVVLGGETGGAFQKLIKQFIIDQTESKVKTLALVNTSPMIPPAVYAQFFAGAFISVLVWWLEHDMPYSAEQMAQYFLLMHDPLFFPHS